MSTSLIYYMQAYSQIHYRAIDNVQPALTEVAKVIEETTGLKCHFMVAGPEPRRKGKIVTITLVTIVVVIISVFAFVF